MKGLFRIMILLALTSTALAQEKAYLGKWDITGAGKHADHVYWLEVRKEAGSLTGYFLNRGGSVLKVPAISVVDGNLKFEVAQGRNSPNLVHNATVSGGKLIGKYVTRSGETVEWVGVRPPRWGKSNANAKRRFGKPIELFDGKSMDAWGVQFGDKPSGWSVVDGTMTNQAGANNLVSKEKFKNFRIRCEYKLEPKSNSGIYLRGRYELQVLDDFGKEAESHGHMAIYSRVAPAVNASKAPGEWQEMEATIVGNRVTVTLNGQKVHDNAVLDGITGGALDSNEGAAGPIMLQGDHGRVWFRKITVTPIMR
jgi:hypothetical protein